MDEDVSVRPGNRLSFLLASQCERKRAEDLLCRMQNYGMVSMSY